MYINKSFEWVLISGSVMMIDGYITDRDSPKHVTLTLNLHILYIPVWLQLWTASPFLLAYKGLITHLMDKLNATVQLTFWYVVSNEAFMIIF